MVAAFTWSVQYLRWILETRNQQFLEQKLTELIAALHEQSSDPSGTAFIAELRRESEAHAETGLFAIVRRNGDSLFFPDTEVTRAADAELLRNPPNPRQPSMVPGRERSGILVIRSLPEKAGGAIWSIDLGLLLDDTNSTVSEFIHGLVLAGIAFLLLAVIGGLLLARVSLRPIASSIDAARRLNPEDLTARLPLSGAGDELDQLATTVNSLLDRVSQKHEQLIRFTSDASHELRSPLTALRTAIEIAMQQPRSNEGYRELLGMLGEQCQRLTDLVNNLLLLARADAGEIALTVSSVDLALVVREVIELFQPLMDEHRLILRTDIPKQLPTSGDRLRLSQLITNLFDNAIKFTNMGGTIDVRLKSRDGHAVFSIMDTGIGIAPDRLPHIFGRFYRADDSRTRGGAGLGLSICHWIVVAHGGTISVTSELNCGTMILVELPQTLPHSEVPATL
jgi:heavy metal sensor kinase